MSQNDDSSGQDPILGGNVDTCGCPASQMNMTALFFAVAFGDLEVAKALMAAGANKDTKNDVGR